MAAPDTRSAVLAPELPPPRAARAALIALALDLLIIAAATLALTLIVPGAVLALRASQQGLPLESLPTLGAEATLRLLGGDGMFLLLLLQNVLFVAVPLLRVRRARREPLATLGIRAPQPLRLLALGVGLGVVTLLANGVIGTLFALGGIRQNQAELYPLFRGDTLGQLLFVLGAALLVPLGEEVLFRGYVFGTLRRLAGSSAGNIAAAYAASALIFALAHSLAATQGLLALLVPSFVIGLAFAWALDATGSLLPGIIAHALNNGIAFAALLACINAPGGCPAL